MPFDIEKALKTLCFCTLTSRNHDRVERDESEGPDLHIQLHTFEGFEEKTQRNHDRVARDKGEGPISFDSCVVILTDGHSVLTE